MDRVRSVIVLGAGLAGLACALGAARAGAQVQVFDTRAATAEAASAVHVVPNLLRDLDALGVGRACASTGFAYSRVAVLDSKGRALDDLPLQRLCGHHLPIALGMWHADLLQILSAAAQDAGVGLHFARTAVALDTAGAQATVVFNDASAASADLVLVATGVDSAPRRMALPDALPATELGQVWWHARFSRRPALDCPTWLIGPARRLLCVPVSAGGAGLVWIEASREDAAGPAAVGLGELRREFSGLPASTLAGVANEPVPITGHVVREAVPARWFHGRALCVGEAAHALAPHFGQSAAQSVEDACVLSELLQQGLPLGELLQGFSARRVTRARQVAALAGQAARWDLRPTADADLTQLARRMAELVATSA